MFAVDSAREATGVSEAVATTHGNALLLLTIGTSVCSVAYRVQSSRKACPDVQFPRMSIRLAHKKAMYVGRDQSHTSKRIGVGL